MSYGFIITRDVLHEQVDQQLRNATDSDVGIVGPSDIAREHEEALRYAKTVLPLRTDDRETVTKFIAGNSGIHLFRLFDDDGELYYEGLFLGDRESELAFRPLDDFGAPNAGCTRIDYLYPNGQWRPL